MWDGTVVSSVDVKGKEQLLRALAAKGVMSCAKSRGKELHTDVEALDELAPGGALAGGAVHEVLWKKSSPCPTSFALLLARAAQKNGGAVAWCDPERELYLPALSAAGIDLRRLLLLRCADKARQLWALGECMACRGVGATVAGVGRLSQ